MKYANLAFTGGYTQDIILGTGAVVPGLCRGISAYTLDKSGHLSCIACTPSIANPSWILTDKAVNTLYCVNEIQHFHGMPTSMVSAYRILEDYTLELINSQLSGGTDACHAILSPDEKWLIAANYSGSSIAVFPVRADHGLDPASCVLRHRGASVHTQRQDQPHPHQIVLSPDGRHVYVSDLGLDRILCYRADWERGWLIPAPERDIPIQPGSGPRHFIFNPAGKCFYLMTELSCELQVFSFDDSSGAAQRIQSISLADKGTGLAAAIRLHPSGKFVFCSVRGTNQIITLLITENGMLSILSRHPSGGQIPRDFSISADGRFLLVGHQDSAALCTLSIDAENGSLAPVCSEPEPCITAVFSCI